MRILLRADSSRQIGAGHISRMVALAEQATPRGWTVAFAGHTDNADFLAARFAELGVPVLGPETRADGYDAVVVDHYGIGEVRAEVNAAGARLVSFEDGVFGRRAADVVVDCGLAPQPRPDDGSGSVLTGVGYAPLRQVVLEARDKRRARELCSRETGVKLPRSHDGGDAKAPHVLVVLGGGGVWQETVAALLEALRATGRPCTVEALVRGEPTLPEPGPGQRFVVSPPGPSLHGKLVDTDLVVSASGVTLLELCCIGVPTALVQLVDNQAAGYRAAVDGGLAAGLGNAAAFDSPTTATATLATLLAEPAARERLAATASAAVDGHGAARVLDALEGAVR
ncbi:spore coat protein [Prauserella endophytica]|uniref:Spore coat protein n=1 Tax=Prauserella endophytica TaxID=1592324 RepID=A0ABY2SDD3_9PSEU|nr:spore coat protein [Prauserella endophytica]TKG73486.1 spore coat protein [Prauserella endophytica]